MAGNLRQPGSCGVPDNGCETAVYRPIAKMNAFAESGRRQYSFFVRVEYSGRAKALHRSERAGEWPSHRRARGRKRITHRGETWRSVRTNWKVSGQGWEAHEVEVAVPPKEDHSAGRRISQQRRKNRPSPMKISLDSR